MKTTIRLHPLAAPSEPGLSLPDPAVPSLLGALREADVAQADALMRAAVQALLQWQVQAGGPTLVQPRLDAARSDEQLQGFVDWCVAREFGRSWTPTQQGWWAHCRKALAGNLQAQPQLPIHGDFSPARLAQGEACGPAPAPSAVGPVSYDLASLLRDPSHAFEEEQALDWAIRYWEQARKAGLPMDEDFGSFWQQLEWTGLQRHLALAGAFCRLKHEQGLPAGADEQILPRLFALCIKVSTRYVQLSPLTHLLQDLQGSLVQTGFTLR